MAKHPQIGKAWIVYSEDVSSGEKVLLSLLNPRKPIQFVSSYVEQLYVDSFASIDEKIAYKKKTSSWPYPAKILRPAYVVCCGFGPVYWADYCHRIRITGNLLIGEYRFVKTVDSDLEPIEFTDGQVTLHVA